MKKLISTIIATALCVGCLAAGGVAAFAEEGAEKEYFNAAKAEYFVAKAGPNCAITIEDVVDYNGVSGDTGVLVTMSPVEKDTTFTNGYVYMNLPVDVSDVTVDLKVLDPSGGNASGAAAQAHFNDKVQWWSVGFNQKPNTDLFSESAKSVTYMMWGMETKLMQNGWWEGDDKLSCRTDWGASYTVGEHSYGLYADAENPDNFEFKADAIFPDQCDPYAATQTKATLADGSEIKLNPFNMHVSDFENGQAYLHIGMAQPAKATEICEDFVFLVKNVTVEKVYPDGISIGNGSITELEKVIGDKFTLQPTFTPATGVTETDVTWSSSDPTVASVDAETGEITALKVGEATITVTTVNDKSASIVIKVVEEATEPDLEPDPGDGDDGKDDNTGDTDEGGCSSAIGGISLILAGAAVCGSIAFVAKKRKN